jgi:hypothetical protein
VTKPAAIGQAARTAPAPPGWAIMTSKAEAKIQTPGIQLTTRVAAARQILFLPVAPVLSIASPNKNLLMREDRRIRNAVSAHS